jgi:hypothetical protein
VKTSSLLGGKTESKPSVFNRRWNRCEAWIFSGLGGVCAI